MQNVTTKIVGEKLTIEIDLSNAAKAPLSKTGKTRLVANTGGFAVVADSPVKGLKLMLLANIPVA